MHLLRSIVKGLFDCSKEGWLTCQLSPLLIFVSPTTNPVMPRRDDALLSLGRAWALRNDVTHLISDVPLFRAFINKRPIRFQQERDNAIALPLLRPHTLPSAQSPRWCSGTGAF